MNNLSINSVLFSTANIINFAKESYNLIVTAKTLCGEVDFNYHLTGEDENEYILKISNTDEEYDHLDFQNKAIEHIIGKKTSVQLPEIIQAKNGKKIITIPDTQGNTHYIRLFRFIKARLWHDVNPHNQSLLESLGKTMGLISSSLQDFDHPSIYRSHKWDLANIGWIKENLHFIDDNERRKIIDQFLKDYDHKILPVLKNLRLSACHNDANDYNILVSPEKTVNPEVIGIVDFGDMVYTQTINELAITCAYGILDKPDPLTAAAEIVKGFNEIYPLQELELEALYYLIKARVCQSLTNSAIQKKLKPENDYLTISEGPFELLLEKLEKIQPEYAHYTFRNACNLTPCPNSITIKKWLEDNQDFLGNVVDVDFESVSPYFFDFSVGSLELGNNSEFADVKKFTRKLWGILEDYNSIVGIGAYDEARPFYTSGIFEVKGNNGPEWRTVHLGTDIFMDPRTSVYCPIDGIIFGFNNNQGNLDYGPTIIIKHFLDDQKTCFYTLYGHLTLESLNNISPGQKVNRGQKIAEIGNFPVNGNWAPHLHFQIICDIMNYKIDFPGVALPNHREIWKSICPDPNLILKIPNCKFQNYINIKTEEIIKYRKEYLGSNLSISYQKPLKITRGYMQYLYDEDGRAFLDTVNNVPHVGHSHPKVVEVAQKQMAVLNTNTRYLHDNINLFAKRLCSTLPEPLRVCFFVNSGSEANELALRLARNFTKQKDTIVVDAGYHGNTNALIEISPYKFDGPGGKGALPHIHKVPIPDVYRGLYKKDDPEAGKKYASHVKMAIENIKKQGRKVSAFICEPVISCGGQIVLPDNYLKEVYKYIKNGGGVCIADEVQTGFGRIGSHFWAFETQEVVPDIITMGKPIGNGHPLAAVVTTKEIANAFANGMEYFNTFGGNPVSCAIGSTVLEIIQKEQLQTNAKECGDYLMDALKSMMMKYPIIGDVRGLGLFIGFELVTDPKTIEPAEKQATYLINRMKDLGILMSTDGPFHNVIKIKPPKVFNKENANFLISTLKKVLQEDYMNV